MAVVDVHVFPGFLTPVITQLSIQNHRLLFSHASELKGKNTSEIKFCLNRVSNSQPPGLESDTLTTELTGRAGMNQRPRNKHVHFSTNRKLPFIHSLSVPG